MTSPVYHAESSGRLFGGAVSYYLPIPFNIPSYALLTMMVAQVCDLQVGVFIHTLADAHLYSKHSDQVKAQLEHTPGLPPTMNVNPSVSDFIRFTFDGFVLEGLKAQASISAPIAV